MAYQSKKKTNNQSSKIKATALRLIRNNKSLNSPKNRSSNRLSKRMRMIKNLKAPKNLTTPRL